MYLSLIQPFIQIVFGKDLIDLMNIEFTNNGFVVHNKTFEYTINID